MKEQVLRVRKKECVDALSLSRNRLLKVIHGHGVVVIGIISHKRKLSYLNVIFLGKFIDAIIVILVQSQNLTYTEPFFIRLVNK